MKDEIKEICKEDNELVVYYEDNSTKTFDTLTIDVLDYITNLQEKNEKLKELCDKYEEEHNTAFKLWKGKLKETMDETLIQKQHDRIKELEQINEEHRKINGELREENEKSKNGVSLEKASDKTMILTQKSVIEQLKTRIDKAIEYINISLRDSFENDKYPLNGEDFEHLLNILQGKSDE